MSDRHDEKARALLPCPYDDPCGSEDDEGNIRPLRPCDNCRAAVDLAAAFRADWHLIETLARALDASHEIIIGHLPGCTGQPVANEQALAAYRAAGGEVKP